MKSNSPGLAVVPQKPIGRFSAESLKSKSADRKEERVERAVLKALAKSPAAASLGLTGQAPTVRIAISSSDAGVDIQTSNKEESPMKKTEGPEDARKDSGTRGRR